MATAAQNFARNDQSHAWIVRIEGLGPRLTDPELTAAGGDSRYRFCFTAPSHASTQPAALWLDYLASLPTTLAERADELGGSTQYGGTQARILDVDDLLTGLVRAERAPSTRLTTTMTSATADVTVQVGDTSTFTVGDPIYIGGERLRVRSIGTIAGIAFGGGQCWGSLKPACDYGVGWLSQPPPASIG